MVSKALSQEMQEYQSFFKIKVKIKLWNPKSCPCKFCKSNERGEGYM